MNRPMITPAQYNILYIFQPILILLLIMEIRSLKGFNKTGFKT